MAPPHTGLSRPPSCEVTSDDGNPVAVGEPEGYHQGDGLESAYEFPVASGTTYTVSCDSAETGRFDVAQESAPPQGVFIGAGSLGLVLCGVGAILTSGRAVRLLRPPSGADEAGPVVPKG